MRVNQDYYALLRVSPGAGEEELRQAYRLAARRFHPDVNKAPGSAILFREINAAYEVLSDARTRAEYDQLLADHLNRLPALQLNTYYSRNHLKKLGEPQLLYVMLHLQPVLEMNLISDAPLNLGLVIDRSKSMQGQRMQHVKSAARRIVDESRPDDIISVVVFSDDADVIVPARKNSDPKSTKAMISTIRADGATEILKGLRKGVAQVERNLEERYVNHLILITDGRTFGDEEECIVLAAEAHTKGIGISGIGIGEDWNDNFLDAIASRTGGSSAYISSPYAVTGFLNDRVRTLATAYAERASLVVAPATGVNLDAVTRMSPNPIELSTEDQPIPLGTIDGLTTTSVVFQFQVETDQADLGEFFIGRLDVSGEVLGSAQMQERAVQDLTVQVTEEHHEENPPPELLDALSRLMLYRLQDRARDALEEGNVIEATRRLEFLATRLFESGEDELGQAAMYEAQRVSQTQALSEEGAKRLKYGTRALFSSDDRG
jgi:Ca-activated chloride channel family protein